MSHTSPPSIGLMGGWCDINMSREAIIGVITLATLGTLLLVKRRIATWIWVLVMTGPRDLMSLIRLLKTKYFLYQLKKKNGNVITVFRENVKRHPHKTIFYFNEKKWSFLDLELYSNRVANCFTDMGFRAGDEVALFLESKPEYVGIWLGLAKAGIISALINTNQRSETLIHSITVIKCKAVIFGSELSQAVKQVIPGVNQRNPSMIYLCLGEMTNGLTNGNHCTTISNGSKNATNGYTKDILAAGDHNGFNPKIILTGNGHNNVSGHNTVVTNGSGDNHNHHEMSTLTNNHVNGSATTTTIINGIPVRSLHKMIEGSSPDASLIKHHPNFTDRLFYIYTSGTTGLPKAAIIKHARYIWIGSALRNLSGIPKGNIIYTCIPLYHLSGGVLGTNQCLIWGDSMVIRHKFSASRFWDDCIKYNCNMAQYIGEICRYLMAQPPKATDTTHKVTTIFGNGLRPEIWSSFVKRFNIKHVGEFYGSTEGNANIINNTNKDGACGFISQILPGVYPVALIKVDEKTREPIRDPKGLCVRAGPGESGEFVGKIILNDASRAFDGYVDSEATAKKIIRDVYRKGDAAFLSGDLLTMDDYGYVYFKDRTGDTFRWRGENVSTMQVEAIISNILNLKDCVVYGVEVPGCEGKAGMVSILDPEKCINLIEFLSELRKRLPPFAIPTFVRIVDQLEATGTYKLPKSWLQKQAFDPNIITDPLFFLDPKTNQYQRMDSDLYQQIITGHVRL